MELLPTPDKVYQSLFYAIQTSKVLEDSKTFVDSVPKYSPGHILKSYLSQFQENDFCLKTFINENFEMTSNNETVIGHDKHLSVREYIDLLWDDLGRSADVENNHSSLIALPKPYIVPGGRFQEIYYWDSYFTMLGLVVSGRVRIIENMVDNFAYLIDTVGFVPNGNRHYYCTRSQPPFFGLMVELLANAIGDDTVFVKYLPQLKKEYQFWMDGTDKVTEEVPAFRRIVKAGDGYLNRYWDDSDQPRQESYIEDVELAVASGQEGFDLYRNLRAGCESGWDFSSRWFTDGATLDSIDTTNVVPVDLNSLLFKLEAILAKGSDLSGDADAESFYRQQSESRRRLINQFLYDRKNGHYVDVALPELEVIRTCSLASMFPLFAGLAPMNKARETARNIRDQLLRGGGWVTTPNKTGQQWDAPNGWAPLQWVVYKGLKNYGFDDDANEGAKRWVQTNLAGYQRTGQLAEKYDVENTDQEAGGGEYPLQNGFGWTNGVLLQFMEDLGL